AGIAFSDFDAFVPAEIFLRNLCELEPEDHLAWYNLAIALGREGRYAESVQMYDECIQRNAAFADAYFQKAYCFELMDDLDQAAATGCGFDGVHVVAGALPGRRLPARDSDEGAGAVVHAAML
ncbi:MAG: tetratricopeptide repeat protein, partial [Chloroflexi bacterium]|nr:tetratricopeptide repeat protein [Chloroflexota bacterium]